MWNSVKSTEIAAIDNHMVYLSGVEVPSVTGEWRLLLLWSVGYFKELTLLRLEFRIEHKGMLYINLCVKVKINSLVDQFIYIPVSIHQTQRGNGDTAYKTSGGNSNLIGIWNEIGKFMILNS